MQAYDPNVCNQKLTQTGNVPICDQLPGAQYHCLDLVNMNPSLHKSCSDYGIMYFPIQVTACIRYVNNQPVQYKYFPPSTLIGECTKMGLANPEWQISWCYCCCSCFAYGTPVAVPGGYVMIQKLVPGEEVMTARADNAGGLEWKPSQVTFSQGVDRGTNPVMVYVAFERPDGPGDLVCSTDQPFLLSSGKLVRAQLLRPGDDLMGRDGQAVPVRTVAIGSYTGGVHHIATGNRWEGSADGHLIDTAGVVTGDFTLQLHFGSLDNALKVEDHAHRAELGTEAYDQEHGHLKAEAAVLFSRETAAAPRGGAGEDAGDAADPMVGTVRVQTGTFAVFSTAHTGIYRNSAKFLTPAQAREVMTNGTQIPISNAIPKGMVDNLFHIFKGFFPEINFYLDWYHMQPNVFSFELFDQKTVVVTGGLARMSGFTYEGMAMAIADGVARFKDVKPIGDFGLSGTGAADWYAFGVISRVVWYGNTWLKPVLAAYAQVEALFALVKEHAGGDPHDPVNRPSLECRLSAMQSGVGGGDIPECAGGPPLPKIRLESATWNDGEIDLLLSVAALSASSGNVDNYVLDPEALIESATPDPRTDTIVMLKAAVQPDTKYTVTIRNLDSILGTGVDPEHDSAQFSTPPAPPEPPAQ